MIYLSNITKRFSLSNWSIQSYFKFLNLILYFQFKIENKIDQIFYNNFTYRTSIIRYSEVITIGVDSMSQVHSSFFFMLDDYLDSTLYSRD